MANNLDAYKIQMKGNRVIGMMVPIIQSYVQILRNNYPNYPSRLYSRNSEGHKFELLFKVTQFELPNGVTTPGPIMVDVNHNGERVFQIEIPGTMIILMDGLCENTDVYIKQCEFGDWDVHLERQISYFIREASMCH